MTRPLWRDLVPFFRLCVHHHQEKKRGNRKKRRPFYLCSFCEGRHPWWWSGPCERATLTAGDAILPTRERLPLLWDPSRKGRANPSTSRRRHRRHEPRVDALFFFFVAWSVCALLFPSPLVCLRVDARATACTRHRGGARARASCRSGILWEKRGSYFMCRRMRR